MRQDDPDGGWFNYLVALYVRVDQNTVSVQPFSFPSNILRASSTLSYSDQCNCILLMSIQAWADAARQAKHYEGVEHQRAINELESLLVANTAPEKAATTISSIYTPLLKDRSKPSPIGTLWAILCDAVRALGGDEELADRLVQLVNGISKLPDVKDDQGNAITPKWAGAGVYWRDLPELSMIFREYAIGKATVVCRFQIPRLAHQVFS